MLRLFRLSDTLTILTTQTVLTSLILHVKVRNIFVSAIKNGMVLNLGENHMGCRDETGFATVFRPC